MEIIFYIRIKYYIQLYMIISNVISYITLWLIIVNFGLIEFYYFWSSSDDASFSEKFNEICDRLSFSLSLMGDSIVNLGEITLFSGDTSQLLNLNNCKGEFSQSSSFSLCFSLIVAKLFKSAGEKGKFFWVLLLWWLRIYTILSFFFFKSPSSSLFSRKFQLSSPSWFFDFGPPSYLLSSFPNIVFLKSSFLSS